MREFGIPFTKGLVKGLRAFPSPLSGEEELIECWNLIPGEHALMGHRPITPLDFSAPYVEYFAIKDQSNVVWYWMAGVDLSTIYSTSIPDVASDGFEAIDITPGTIPSWIQMNAFDVPSTPLYVWPAEFSGDQLVLTSPPPLGTGYVVPNGLTLQSFSGWKHRMQALTSQDVFWQQIGA